MNALKDKSQFLTAVKASITPTLTTIDGLGDVYLKPLSVLEQGELAKKTDKEDNITSSLLMVTYSICDEHGKPLFAVGDIKELGKINTQTLTCLITAISKLNGFDASLEDTKKNS